MNRRFLRYTQSGILCIFPDDDPEWIVDAMLHTGYDEEFCAAFDFDPVFTAGLMRAGFLVMSTQVGAQFLLLPKLHLLRSVLFFPDLRVTKTAGRLLKRYELRFDTDFDTILDRCAEVHGDDWLTFPLRESIRKIHARKDLPVHPASFGVYREGKLAAGEFGVISGNVYTSYSGYRDEDSAGTVQMALTGRYLRDRGFAFWDLGMPLDYKDRLGAVNVEPRCFVELFRESR
jgi:Leu/Phe-tRNA-protein transferase